MIGILLEEQKNMNIRICDYKKKIAFMNVKIDIWSTFSLKLIQAAFVGAMTS